jgi:phosphatidylserine synthase
MTRFGIPGWSPWLMLIPSFLFVAGAISRLAWFNISTNEGYTGLPTPVTAGFVAITVATDVFAYELDFVPSGFNYFMHYAIIFIPIMLAWFNVTDLIVYGKTIRKKSGRIKFIMYSVFIIAIVLFMMSLVDFPGRTEIIFGGLLILWFVLLGFIGFGLYTGITLKRHPEESNKESEPDKKN